MCVDCPFNLQITEEFIGEKVDPKLTIDIVKIYKEIATRTKEINGIEYEFSHGDFSPWNIKKNGKHYIVFDWEHCGYRIRGFDLMHFVTIIKLVINGENLSQAFDNALTEVKQYLPNFEINKDDFIMEFTRLRTQI